MPGRHSAPHRGGVTRWIFVGALVVILGLVGWVGWRVLQGARGATPVSATAPSSATATTALSSTASPTSSPTATGSPTTTSARPSPRPTATRTATATPTAKPSPTPARSGRVAVYNATLRGGYAARTARQLRATGWTVVAVGNWAPRPPATTVYYPPGQVAAARTLAADLRTSRIRPALSGMPAGLLVVVLAS